MKLMRALLVALAMVLSACPDTEEVDNSSPSPTETPNPPTPSPTAVPPPTTAPVACAFQWVPDSLEYGQVTVGETESRSATLEATAGTACEVTSLTLGGADASFWALATEPSLPVSLSPDEPGLTVSLIFEPTLAGSARAELTAVGEGLEAGLPLKGEGLAPDRDGDGIPDDQDLCPDAVDPDQLDTDGDGLGDVCDGCPKDAENDVDEDGVCGDVDNCPVLANPSQGDQDGDGLGEACDSCPLDAANDQDQDGICGELDNCVEVANSDQEDDDQDGLGNACDQCPLDADNDIDQDQVCGDKDNCPAQPNPEQQNADGDGLGDVCDACPADRLNDVDGDGICGDVDNCPTTANAEQTNSDADPLGDACDRCPADDADDQDQDGVCDSQDNCISHSNFDQQDTDQDGQGDACDACPLDPENDVDQDGLCADVDNCPQAANAQQEDADGDAVGDACDSCPQDSENDIDQDGVCGDVDNCPATSNASQGDTDGDTLGDACDDCPSDAENDVDGDGVCGDVDSCPNNANPAQENQDGDARGDVCDPCPLDGLDDEDGDGLCADVDSCPNVANPGQENADGDLEGDVCDACPFDAENDLDGDSVCGDVDNCVSSPNFDQANEDGDGLGDVCDACPLDSANDIDQDGVCGNVDNCPELANGDQSNLDGDAAGDVCDTCSRDLDNDLDQDGVCGDVDNCPVVSNAGQEDVDVDGVGDACDAETCDARDNDGDGLADEDFPDLDGIGAADCFDQDRDGYTEDQGDCQDEDPESYPGADELWYDGKDSDCDAVENPPYCQELPPVVAVSQTSSCNIDLETRVLGLCDGDCSNNTTVVVEFLNHGSVDSPDGVEVAIYGVTTRGMYALLSVEVIDSIPAGFSSGGMVFDLGPFENLYYYPSIVVAVDDNRKGGGSVAECDETNNFDTGLTVELTCPVPEVCQVAPPGYPVPSDSSCSYTPPHGAFQPKVEWQKSTFTASSTYNQIMMMPVVGNLTDDNGDGKVNDLDVPDIAFNCFTGSSYGSVGVMRVISGADGRELWTYTNVFASAGIALGDVDADGFPEVFSLNGSGQLIRLSRTGALQWTSTATATSGYNYPAIGDMNQDGKAEITNGRAVVDTTGKVLSTLILNHAQPFFIDVDQDGSMEIASGAGVSKADGSTLWSGPGGYGAMANFDSDSQPELVSVTGNMVYLTDHQGTRLWGVSVPGAGGGPPTIADFDGDGDPEIGVAGAAYYVVFEKTGTVKWQAVNQDNSSRTTGSSVYDFEGDGAAEVVYADEINLYVFEGATGKILLKETNHSSGTLQEYPVIADVDRDGHAEIILASNNYAFSGWTGITVLGDAVNNWVGARPVWNQHAYHISNVNDDLSIPKKEEAWWITGNNSFRQGGFAQANSQAAPDLVPVFVDQCGDLCPTTAKLLFQVENRGANDVGAGLPWTIYGVATNGTKTKLLTGTVPDPIPAGWASFTQSASLSVASSALYDHLILAVDDAGTGSGVQSECVETNNTFPIPTLCAN